MSYRTNIKAQYAVRNVCMNEFLYSLVHHKNKSNIIKNTRRLAINKKYILITGGTNYLKKLPN